MFSGQCSPLLHEKLCPRGKAADMVLFMEQPASAIKEEATNVVHAFHQDCYYTVLPSYVWPAPSADIAILRGTMAHHVFGTHYPAKLSSFYGIIERLLCVPEDRCSKVMKPSVIAILKHIKC